MAKRYRVRVRRPSWLPPGRVTGMRKRQADREFLRRFNFGPRPSNPLRDPLESVKQPRLKGRFEFGHIDVQHIRAKFGASQQQFAWLIGISRETLRNWERGRRRPTGPARAQLRAIDADPVALGRALLYFRMGVPKPTSGVSPREGPALADDPPESDE